MRRQAGRQADPPTGETREAVRGGRVVGFSAGVLTGAGHAIAASDDTVPRPFYLIGHNPNTPELARAFIDAGANALEPDLRFVDREISAEFLITLAGVERSGA
jgi:hypothetical protein